MSSQYLSKDRRCFGEYRCPQCNRHWMSGNSWVGKGQECQTCKINVMPYNQRKLQWSGEDEYDSKAPHPQHLCQKCRELGRSCVTLRR